MPEPDFLIRTGDTSSIIQSTLRDENGDAVNISGATIKFHLQPINGSGTPALNVAATNDQNTDGSDGSKGNVSYQWVAGNTSLAGLYLAEWEVTFTNNQVETFPNGGYILVRMTPALA